MHKHGALCLPFFPRAVELCPRSTGVFLRRDTKAESLGFFSEFSDLALKAISPFSDRFPEVARHNCPWKLGGPRPAGSLWAFSEDSPFSVPAPIRYTGLPGPRRTKPILRKTVVNTTRSRPFFAKIRENRDFQRNGLLLKPPTKNHRKWS